MKPALKNILEGALLAAGEPLSVERLRSLFSEEEKPSQKMVQQALQALCEDYQDRGFELIELASC